MFSDIHAAESLVALLSIFSERPNDLDWSVAHVRVDPPGAFPIVQYDGREPSNPPMVLMGISCAAAGSTNAQQRRTHCKILELCIVNLLMIEIRE
jgi:hypothetical protein